MYLIYKTDRSGKATEFTKIERHSKVHLFGRKEGWIPWILQQQLSRSAPLSEPLCWHLSEAEIYSEVECDQAKPSGNTLLIDLKPKSPKLFLFEIAEAWGHSAEGWTPIMLRLRALFNDADRAAVNISQFLRLKDEIKEPMFSFYYVNGSVEDGKLKGTWNLPGRGSTNSVVLWRDTMTYFNREAEKAMAKFV